MSDPEAGDQQSTRPVGSGIEDLGAFGRGLDLSTLRRAYAAQPLLEAEMAADPFAQFARWFSEIVQLPEAVVEPNAMVFSTADENGHPSSRTVLLKGFDERGFVLFTNYSSRKGREALANPFASLVFPWHHVERQVIVVGAVEKVEQSVTAEYFASRPRESQIGAWTSRQSTVVESRDELEARRVDLERRFEGVPVPVPDFWGGLRVVPETVEFWHGRAGRLHDRLRYRRDGASWTLERLCP